MKKIVFILLSLLFVAVIAYFFINKSTSCTHPCKEKEKTSIPQIEYGLPVDSFRIESYTLGKDEYISQILYSLGASHQAVNWIGQLSDEAFDVRRLRPGQTYKAFYSLDSTRRLRYFVYEKSPINYSLFCLEDSFTVVHSQKDVHRILARKEAVINSSLWNAATDNDIPATIALQLSDIYAWAIDFFGLQKEDRFTVLYDELYVDSVFVGTGKIYAAKFLYSNKEYPAFHFEQDSIGSYWDDQGNSLKRAFLKAPLQFSRISSHFSHARKHPVLRTVRPHTGVDYAAPTGTPVMSIGDGTVIEKGYKGGGGHTVKIRHNSVYTTAYLHLSKYAKDIRIGARVKQGQIIGNVGSTGLSTGPHLDFRVWKNGKAVNPLTVESPPVEPISEANKLAFDSICSVFIERL